MLTCANCGLEIKDYGKKVFVWNKWLPFHDNTCYLEYVNERAIRPRRDISDYIE
jgi:hypothetical protein